MILTYLSHLAEAYRLQDYLPSGLPQWAASADAMAAAFAAAPAAPTIKPPVLPKQPAARKKGGHRHSGLLIGSKRLRTLAAELASDTSPARSITSQTLLRQPGLEVGHGDGDVNEGGSSENQGVLPGAQRVQQARSLGSKEEEEPQRQQKQQQQQQQQQQNQQHQQRQQQTQKEVTIQRQRQQQKQQQVQHPPRALSSLNTHNRPNKTRMICRLGWIIKTLMASRDHDTNALAQFHTLLLCITHK